ncbi:hypothetical protein GH733_017379 [Mirounga leonina]|nr:hypothetical protein GH733_017379 [Mirounga leonina]
MPPEDLCPAHDSFFRYEEEMEAHSQRGPIAGLLLSKPDVISWLEQGQDPWRAGQGPPRDWKNTFEKKESASKEDFAVEEPFHHIAMKHCIREEGPWLVSLGERQDWRNQLREHQEDSLSQMVLTSETLFAQGEHCEHDLGGSYLSISLLPPVLPTRAHVHTLDSHVKKLEQNSGFINHEKGWTDRKPYENHQSARAFCQSIYLKKLGNVEMRNKKPYEYTVSSDSLSCGTSLRFHNRLFSAENNSNCTDYGNIVNHSMSPNEHKPMHFRECQDERDECLVQTEISDPREAPFRCEEEQKHAIKLVSPTTIFFDSLFNMDGSQDDGCSPGPIAYCAGWDQSVTTREEVDTGGVNLTLSEDGNQAVIL